MPLPAAVAAVAPRARREGRRGGALLAELVESGAASAAQRGRQLVADAVGWVQLAPRLGCTRWCTWEGHARRMGLDPQKDGIYRWRCVTDQ